MSTEPTPDNAAGAPSLWHAFMATIRRDMTLKLRRRSEFANPLVFFALIVTLFPLGITPRQEVLRELAPGLLWVAALLAVLLSLDSLFRDDFEDGSLEQLLLAPQPASLLILAKIIAHWLTTGVPLTIMAPLLGIMLALPAKSFPVLCATLALGTASLSLIGAIGAALTVGLRRGGVLLSLLVLPLYIPVLIFGAGAVKLAIEGAAVAPYLALLGAQLAGALALAPWAAAVALRISING